MGSQPRMTLATQSVLKVFLDDPREPRYGFDIAKEAKLATGSLYPILSRLEQVGWVTSWWEDIDTSMEARPRRRYYQLTPHGEVAASDALRSALKRMTPKAWRISPEAT
ncbi:PadR family transcriptional regulator [Actinomadura sp. NPDC047616]|uniref:PadR family transcriptional regulator n=1 Tax=Actinomadura sp. NPDC047616 TaxID=3155914 RepID=UPI003403490F